MPAKFAALRDVGPDKEVVLRWGQAGWQMSAQVAVPEHLHPVVLPAESPELQPVERLWPVVDEPLANRNFTDLTELEATL